MNWRVRCFSLFCFSLLLPLLCVATIAAEREGRAYDQWRAQWPPRDLSPRPQDGVNLALTLRKLENRAPTGQPLLIWAIGSSYTNMLGNGEIPKEIIRGSFPNAPEIVYKKHVGASVAFQYLVGWARHIVIPDQPDLVLIYTIGKPEDLDTLLTELRRGCTADIIVPSIHWRIRDLPNWGKSEDAVDQDVSALRAVCRKHGVEFVENRREWAEHLKAQGLSIEIDAEGNLLKDAVHQSEYGKLIINENIARHFAHPAKFAYAPDDRERTLRPGQWKSVRKDETIEYGAEWRLEDGSLVTNRNGARVKVRFQGRRIDLKGRFSENGGSLNVLVDGCPADDVDAFFPDFINVGRNNTRPKRGLVTDRAPHGISLGENIVPQTWTITMIDNAGNYHLEGSETGFDGQGNNLETFTSDSGQIIVPAELWRYPTDRQGNAINRKGDLFRWTVTRTGIGSVSFQGQEGTPFVAKLIQNLPNTTHTLELVTTGGPVRIDAFDIFEPPLP